MRCLAEQPVGKLSPSCRTEMAYLRQTWAKDSLSVPRLAQACRGDAAAQCAQVQPGGCLDMRWSAYCCSRVDVVGLLTVGTLVLPGTDC